MSTTSEISASRQDRATIATAVATVVVAKWENEFDSSKAGAIQVGGAVDAPVAMASGD